MSANGTFVIAKTDAFATGGSAPAPASPLRPAGQTVQWGFFLLLDHLSPSTMKNTWRMKVMGVSFRRARVYTQRGFTHSSKPLFKFNSTTLGHKGSPVSAVIGREILINCLELRFVPQSA